MISPAVTSWAAPDTIPALISGEIHVWLAALDEPGIAPEATALLSSDERARARAYHFERDRTRFTVGRAILRRLLGAYLQRAPAELVFAYGSLGKPELVGSGLHFNVSHSGGLALYAVACDRPVGIDLEEIRALDDLASLEETVFTPDERAAQRAFPQPDRTRRFFERWTQREAVGKCAGVGLFLSDASPGREAMPLDLGEAFAGNIAWSGGTASLRRCRYAPQIAK